MKLIKNAFALGLLLALGGAVLPACGSMGTDICKLQCDCEGCNDNEHEACLVVYEESREAAADYTCGAKFDDYYACKRDRAICSKGDWKTTSGNCEGEGLILEQCIRDNSSLR